jgi:outer membrane scaffolding protein for murein synthesis (MipA/OmpV family)
MPPFAAAPTLVNIVGEIKGGSAMLRYPFAAALLLLAAPAFAQEPLPDPNDQSNTFSIGGGGAYIPDYEGSDDY